MLVAILHNAVSADASAADRDVLVQVEAVAAALAALGHASRTVPCTLDLEAMRTEVVRLRPAVVFNLVESLAGSDGLGYLPAAVLDALGVPYTGSPCAALFATIPKVPAKQRLCQSRLPTPAWAVLAADGSLAWSPPSAARGGPPPGPFIMKTIAEHASFGLEADAIVADAAELPARLAAFTGRLGRPCFAEQFIDGREFNVALLAGADGPQVLPPAEIDFTGFRPGQPRIVGYRAKWEEDSFEYGHTVRRFDFPATDRPLLRKLAAAARRCWAAFDLGGYARVDFRVDTAAKPWILEINANPCLSPDAGLAAALDRAGIAFPQAVARILDNALRR